MDEGLGNLPERWCSWFPGLPFGHPGMTIGLLFSIDAGAPAIEFAH
jgi:hypothetical protein